MKKNIAFSPVPCFVLMLLGVWCAVHGQEVITGPVRSAPLAWNISQGTTVEILGKGVGADNSKYDSVRVDIPNPGNVDSVYALVTQKRLQERDYKFVSSNGEQATSKCTWWSNSSMYNIVRFNPCEWIKAHYKDSSDDGNWLEISGLTLIVFRNTGKKTANIGEITGFKQNYHPNEWEPGMDTIRIAEFTIGTSSGRRDIEVAFNLADFDYDGRWVKIYASAGGVEQEQYLCEINPGKRFINLPKLKLAAVPGTATNVTIRAETGHALKSQCGNKKGDSFFLTAINISIEESKRKLR